MTGEPDALKGARPVRKGIERKGLVTVPRSQSTLLSIDEKVYGPDHPDVAIDLHNLATLYDAQGKYDQAEPLYQRALTICEQALGPDHPNTQTVRGWYARLQEKMGRSQTE